MNNQPSLQTRCTLVLAECDRIIKWSDLNDGFKPAAAVAIRDEIKRLVKSGPAFGTRVETTLDRLTAPFGNGYLWE